MKDNKAVNRGVTFCELLALLFIGLKLGNVIDWGWEWVLLPIYGPVVLIFGIALLLLCVQGALALWFYTKER